MEPTLSQDQDLSLSAHLLPLIEQRQELSRQIKAMQSLVDGLTESITGAMVRDGIDEVEAGEWRVRYLVSERRTLDKTRLVELGVGTDVIKAAEKVSTVGRIDVREKKG